MSSEIQIYDLRLSFIWVETILDFIRNSAPPAAPLAFLGRSDQYIQAFEQALQTGSGPEGLQVPWDQQSKASQFFWSHYLRSALPGYTPGERAWKSLVPFRRRLPAKKVEAPWLPGRLDLKSLFYPHGIALVVTAECRSSFALEEAVEKAFEVRKTARFQVKWDEGETESLSLDKLAAEALSALRRLALGSEAPPRARPVQQPFTVATVASGTGVEKEAPPPEEVLCALHAMTKWPSYDWEAPPPSELPSVDQVDQEKIKERYPGDVLYYQTRGRAVWFPKHFLPKKKRQVQASCYHKNLVFLSLQIESLGDLISKTAEQIQAETELSLTSTHRTCAENAAIRLSLLYGGGGKRKETYRSWSARRQIEQNMLVTALNEVRDRVCDWGPLSS